MKKPKNHFKDNFLYMLIHKEKIYYKIFQIIPKFMILTFTRNLEMSWFKLANRFVNLVREFLHLMNKIALLEKDLNLLAC